MEFAILIEDTQCVKFTISKTTSAHTHFRIDIQDRVRRLGLHPHENDQHGVEQKRQVLASLLVKLKTFQETASVVSTASGTKPFFENEGEFDEVGESVSANEVTPAHSNATAPNVFPVEWQLLTIPSNGNVLGNLCELELHHRTKQARRQVDWLQDIVANISFQDSHVVCGAIRKTVWTTAQKHTKSLHRDLILHARIYTHCRSQLMALDCDERWLQIFWKLINPASQYSRIVLSPIVMDLANWAMVLVQCRC